MTRPDFIVIGAMKAGTTTLQEQLARQTGIFMTTPKEPNFFSDDNQFAKGEGWYSGLFDDAAPTDLTGEASTHYTKLPTYPATIDRMKARGQAPKLIYLIRNPMERIVSHYLHGWSQTEISVPFQQALTDHPELVDYGRYAMQIKPYIKAFGEGAVHLISLEEYKADAGAVLADIGAFLGAPTPLRVVDFDAQNVTADRYRKLPFSNLLVENPVARGLRRALVPKVLRERIRQARTRKDRPLFTDTDRARMEKIFRADRDDLATLFPDHPALHLCYPFAS